MDFQHLASTETTALVDGLLQEHRATSLRHIRLLREALDAAAHDIAAPPDPGPLLQAVTDRLTGALAAELGRVRDEAAAALAAVHAQLETEQARSAQHASDAAQAQAEASRLEIELAATREQAAAAAHDAAERAAQMAAHDETRRTDIERLAAALAEAEREMGRLAADAQAERERADTADQDLAVTVEAHAELERSLRQAHAEARQAAQARAAVEGELTASRTALEHTQAEANRLREQAERDAAAIAALERQVAEALHAGADRDALAAELEARGARIRVLEEASANREAESLVLENRLRDAAQAEAQLLEDLAARELALENEQTTARGTREALEALASQHDAPAARIEALERELAAAAGWGAERDALRTSLDESAERIEALQTELAASARAGAERDALAGSLHDSAARIDMLQAELARAAEAARQERDGLMNRLEISVARVEELERAQADHSEERARLESRLDEVSAREARLRDEVTALNGVPEAVDALRSDVDRLAALFDASARAVTEMSSAPTSAELLIGLAKRLSLQFSRVALFRLKGDRLAVEEHLGFDEGLDLRKDTLPLSGDSLPARAARSGAAESLSGVDAGATGLPFGGTLTAAISLPLVLHGVTIAVVYADDADVPESARGPAVHDASVAYARLLVGHVVALLVRHTQELKTLAELRDYAATLLHEARTMYLADAESGRTGDALRIRLKENIDCASQLYAYRAAMEGTAAAALFDDQLAEEAAGDTALARDLRQVLAACESIILKDF
jgi:hypothetical protein